MKSLQIYTEKQMDMDLKVVPSELGFWLLENGWTRQEPEKSRRWKKQHSSMDTDARAPTKPELRHLRCSQKFSARHRPWYIVFKYDPLKLSSLAFTKNVIFEKRTKTEPEVYWELRNIAEALHVSIEAFRLKQWLVNQQDRFEALRQKFDFDLVTLLSCQGKDTKQSGKVPKTCLTQETLLNTIGVMAMLLHWATNKMLRLDRQKAAKDIMTDILRRVFDGVEDKKKIRTWCTEVSAAQKTVETSFSLKTTLRTNQTTSNLTDVNGTTCCEDKMKSVKSMHQQVTDSLLYLFANREKHQHLHALLGQGLSILNSEIEDVIVKGKVGQVSPVFPAMWLESEVCRTKGVEDSCTEKRKQDKFTDSNKARKIKTTSAEANARMRSEC